MSPGSCRVRAGRAASASIAPQRRRGGPLFGARLWSASCRVPCAPRPSPLAAQRPPAARARLSPHRHASASASSLPPHSFAPPSYHSNAPGAYQGRGRGNAFLNDLCDADVLIHVVDASGTTDAGGGAAREGEGADPCDDIRRALTLCLAPTENARAPPRAPPGFKLRLSMGARAPGPKSARGRARARRREAGLDRRSRPARSPLRACQPAAPCATPCLILPPKKPQVGQGGAPPLDIQQRARKVDAGAQRVRRCALAPPLPRRRRPGPLSFKRSSAGAQQRRSLGQATAQRLALDPGAAGPRRARPGLCMFADAP